MTMKFRFLSGDKISAIRRYLDEKGQEVGTNIHTAFTAPDAALIQTGLANLGDSGAMTVAKDSLGDLGNAAQILTTGRADKDAHAASPLEALGSAANVLATVGTGGAGKAASTGLRGAAGAIAKKVVLPQTVGPIERLLLGYGKGGSFPRSAIAISKNAISPVVKTAAQNAINPPKIAQVATGATAPAAKKSLLTKGNIIKGGAAAAVAGTIGSSLLGGDEGDPSKPADAAPSTPVPPTAAPPTEAPNYYRIGGRTPSKPDNRGDVVSSKKVPGGASISDAELTNAILQYPSKAAFEAAIGSAGLSPADMARARAIAAQKLR